MADAIGKKGMKVIMKQFDIPILFCTFNRLDCTKRVFEKIREVRPTKLYLVSDGSRENVKDEDEKVNTIRKYMEDHIDWECQVRRNYAESNMGCGKRISSGISWAFEQEEKLIILEDDCLVDFSFFRYCKELLELYEKNENIMMVGGYNPLGTLEEEDGFIFTPIIEIWGWATWRRAWNQYDYDILDWKEHKVSDYMKAVMDDKSIKHYSKLFDYVYTHEIDTWDYQLQYLVLQKGMLAIIPGKNMVKNIGFGLDATHTIKIPNELYNESHQMDFPMQIPTEIGNNEVYTKQILNVYVK